jgi:hypothetical protein
LDLRGRKWQETGEECTMRSFVTSDKMKWYVMGGTRNTLWRREIYTEFWLEYVTGGDHSEGLCSYGRIILECILGK